MKRQQRRLERSHLLHNLMRLKTRSGITGFLRARITYDPLYKWRDEIQFIWLWVDCYT